ncbi:MAG: hydrogenase maturation nickel metallochaperone HypA [Actinobacteria bacterium]|nr:hydrogenase maturation nickel metallochaperone HypA [Actinomycetota bacterium]
MHELALAESVLAIAGAHARGRRVRRVTVAAGALRQVVPGALTLAFALLSAGTPLAGAELEVRTVPAVVRCRDCGASSEQDGFPLACAACGALDVEVTAGEQLLVEELEVEQEAEVSHVR